MANESGGDKLSGLDRAKCLRKHPQTPDSGAWIGQRMAQR